MSRLHQSFLQIGALMAMMDSFGQHERYKALPVNAGNGNNQHKPKGLKQFFIDGREIWAINEKNAIRKSRKV